MRDKTGILQTLGIPLYNEMSGCNMPLCFFEKEPWYMVFTSFLRWDGVAALLLNGVVFLGNKKPSPGWEKECMLRQR